MHNIQIEKTIELPLYNDGANEMNIKFAKESLLMEAFRTQTDFVTADKRYPANNLIKIDLSLDVVLMTVSEYNELVRQAK